MNDPILIVGAGPTGLTAALELSRMGVAVRLVDRRAAPATTSRAIGVQARTLELFEQRGLADEMVRLGNKGGYGSVYGGGSRVFRLDFGQIESRFPYLLFISQAETERILRDALARHGVVPEWNTELIAFQQNPHAQPDAAVRAVLKRPDGALQDVAASWLIAAEGAHSLVRTTLDLPYEGHTREEHYALGDLLIDGDLADTDFYIFSSESGFMGLFPMGGAHFRLIASHPVDDTSAGSAPSLADLQSIYDRRSPIPARFHDLAWSSWFRINSRMVSRLRTGRLLLGGDSAHIHSPAGAQGMNTGIQDMINLCWKLAYVLQGRAPEALLDTYEADRLPVMRGVLTHTDSLTTMIGTENTWVRSLFNHVGPFIGGANIVQENATANMSQLALNYHDSPLSHNHTHTGTLRAGDRVPDLAVRQIEGTAMKEVHLLSLLDPSRFTLVIATPDGVRFPDDARHAIDADACVQIAPSAIDTAAAGHFTHRLGKEGVALLCRPDGYVALTSTLVEAAQHVKAFQQRWLMPQVTPQVAPR